MEISGAHPTGVELTVQSVRDYDKALRRPGFSVTSAPGLDVAWLGRKGYRQGTMVLKRVKSRGWVKSLSLSLPAKAWNELRVDLPIRVLQKLTLPVFRKAGYRWEVRRIGDIKVGFLRLKTHSKRRSNPKRFVFLPGFGDSPMSWLPVFLMLRPVLRRNYDEVILLDFPGFMGYLAQERPIPSMDVMRSVVFDIFDSLRPDTIMGHSLGAWLVAAYAIDCGHGHRPVNASMHYRHPKKIILANPSGVLADEWKKEEWYNKFRVAREGGSSGDFRKFVFANEPIWFGTVANSFMSFLDKKEVIDFMDSVREDHLVTDRLEPILARTWLLWGERDGLVPSKWVHDWLERLNPVVAGGDDPLAEEHPAHKRGPSHAVVIRGAGHSPHLERPLTTAAALGRILSGRPFKPSMRLWSRLTWDFHDGASNAPKENA